MATTTTRAQALFTVPFSHNTDFTELADHCERFAHTLLETDDPAEKLALCLSRAIAANAQRAHPGAPGGAFHTVRSAVPSARIRTGK